MSPDTDTRSSHENHRWSGRCSFTIDESCRIVRGVGVSVLAFEIVRRTSLRSTGLRVPEVMSGSCLAGAGDEVFSTDTPAPPVARDPTRIEL